VFVVLNCIISSLLYYYLAAFGVPAYDSPTFKKCIFFEIVFLLDMILQFFLEYKPEDSYKLERNLYKIGIKYLKGDFFRDFFVLIPIEIILNN
jgi:hypothetical protein